MSESLADDECSCDMCAMSDLEAYMHASLKIAFIERMKPIVAEWDREIMEGDGSAFGPIDLSRILRPNK